MMIRERLTNVRAELVSIGEDMRPIAPTEDPKLIADRLNDVSHALRGLCGILVRVIDSLP